MGTNMPTGLDTLTNPTPTTTQSALPHSTQHTNANDAIEAIEKIVVGPTYVNVKGQGAVGNGSGNDSAGITAAYNSAAQGAIMKWPAGRYMVDPDILDIISSRRIEGDGQYATQIALRSNTSNAAIKIDITTAGPEAGIRGFYQPTVRGIGIDLGAAASAIGVLLTANSGWAWLDDVRIEGGDISFDNTHANAKLTNCHFVNPTTNFMKLHNALELRVNDLIMSKTAGGATLPAAIDLVVGAAGTGLFLTNIYLNNGGTINCGIKAVAPSNMSVPIRGTNIIFDNVAGPSWYLENIYDVMVMGGWANSANGANDPGIKIIGGGRINFFGQTVNGGVGSGSGWASIEFAGGSPNSCTFVGNELNTGPCYRLTGASSGDPVNLLLYDRVASVAVLGNVTNEPVRLQYAMAHLWTPPVLSRNLRYGGDVAGRATLVGGSVTVANTTVDSGLSDFTLTRRVLGGTPGHLYISNVVTGVSFTISSTSNTDTSTVNWVHHTY